MYVCYGQMFLYVYNIPNNTVSQCVKSCIYECMYVHTKAANELQKHLKFAWQE